MNMTPKSMSSNESSNEAENIVLRLNSDSRGDFARRDSTSGNNTFKIKLDDYVETNTRRNITQKKKSDYEDYLDISSSIVSKKKTRSIDRNRVYECIYDDCKKLFNDKGSYRKHQLTHGEKQYPCTQPGCGKKFLDNSKLRRHLLVHTGEKPFRCELCGKKFSLDFNLRTHQRIHTGEKPYACIFPGCFKRFSQSSNLTAHEKTHQPPLQTGATQKPIFSHNPISLMMKNEYSGTLHINNLINMNRLYDMMKEALIQESNNNINSQPGTTAPATFTHQGHTVLFATINTKNQINPPPLINKPNRLFVTKKGQKIFNITKEPHANNRIKTVRIIYKNEEEQSNNQNYNYNYGNEVEGEVKEDQYAHNKKEEYYENAEEDEEYENNFENVNEQNDNYFGSSAYPQYYNIFK